MKIIISALEKFNSSLPNEGKLLDIGALEFSEYKRIKDTHPNIQHYGVDYVDVYEAIPPNYTFKKADLNTEPIPFESDFFDYIVASHIIEHLNDPLSFFQECMRVLKPGGKLYLEAPSEKSLRQSGMSFDYDKFCSLSFYDDPTHTKRPWTPQSFYRMAKYYSCNPIEVGYVRSTIVRILSPLLIPYAYLTRNAALLQKVVWNTIGWAAYAIIEKDRSMKGTPPFHYYIPDQKKN